MRMSSLFCVVGFVLSAQASQAQSPTQCQTDKAAAVASYNTAKGYGNIIFSDGLYTIDTSDVTYRDYQGHESYVFSHYSLTMSQMYDVYNMCNQISTWLSDANTARNNYTSYVNSVEMYLSQGDTSYGSGDYATADAKYCAAYNAAGMARAAYLDWANYTAEAQGLTNTFFLDYP